MTELPARRRAPAMTPDERRAMIVQAALPLVAEFGAAVTTAQVARAAGIGEATVFRAFADKDALLEACVAETLDPSTTLRTIRSIPAGEPLADRLLEAAEALDSYLSRMGAVLGTIRASGVPHRRGPRPASPGGREESRTATLEAVTDLLEASSADLRVPAGQAAEVFLQMQFGWPPLMGNTDRKTMIDVFLHGALAR